LEDGSSNTCTSETAATFPQAIFCFSPPDNLNMLLPKNSTKCRHSAVFHTRFSISFSGIPLFSHVKASLLVVSTAATASGDFEIPNRLKKQIEQRYPYGVHAVTTLLLSTPS